MATTARGIGLVSVLGLLLSGGCGGHRSTLGEIGAPRQRIYAIEEAQAAIPLNGTVGLEAAQFYRVERVFPESSQEIPDRLDVQGEIRFTLPPRSVALLSIQPKA